MKNKQIKVENTDKVDMNIAKQEPSPEFLSSLKLTKKFYPQHKVQTGSHASPQLCGSLCLTKREGNGSNNKFTNIPLKF